MADIIELSFVPPPTPVNWKTSQKPGAGISQTKPRTLLPIGHGYLAHARREINQHTFDQDDEHQAQERLKAVEAFAALNSANGGDDLGVGEEEEDPFLLSLDPKEWKKQDHYAVLGLSRLRFKATPQQIRIAHRKKVLKHHPDKKAGSGDANDDGFFKCISKAFEVLMNPERRAQFDSVDPYYLDLEEDAPTLTTFPKNAPPEKFFKEFTPVFEREARFYKGPIEQVPMLGGVNDSKEKVEEFYDFWYKFESWRSFEYLDKEVNEGSDNRDDKRYTEKKNKSERARRKKEDNARLRNLVDVTLALDPRIKRIKAEEKEERERKKRARVNGVSAAEQQQKEEEEKRKQEEEKRRLEEEEQNKADAKKSKTAAANAAKKARRAARAAEEAAAGGK